MIDRYSTGPGYGLYMPRPVKPKVFVSYHHERDQAYYDRFAKLFADCYDIITDTSIDRIIASDDATHQQQVIREQHITGSSITAALCGAESWKRKWIDWEIAMTLNKRHALLGIGLPTSQRSASGAVIVPDRLHANIVSGYAHFIQWTNDPQFLSAAISGSSERARQTSKIDNSAARMERSRP
jgi:hypothetical protein